MALSFKIEKNFGTISTDENENYKKELNIVSWNGREAKYDIRGWNADHTLCGKGITLTKEEIIQLKKILDSMEISVVS